jgi:hypothetical protein
MYNTLIYGKQFPAYALIFFVVPVLRVNEPKETGARSAQACSAAKILPVNIYSVIHLDVTSGRIDGLVRTVRSPLLLFHYHPLPLLLWELRW